MIQKYPSRLLEKAIDQFATLPGVGRKTALRLALYLLRQPVENTRQFAAVLVDLREHISYCRRCHNISDSDVCTICADLARDQSTLCVVENIRDVMAIENTSQYRGLYHVLGGVISPMDGIGPGDLQIDSLVHRVTSEQIREVILALSTTMEGDTTNFFLFRKLESTGVRVSVIARGIAIGDEIEYADEITLGRSILNRTDFSDSVKF
ncbi:recombinase RecR [Porphyromonas sp. COT-052 OH4946]|uniref:recombination mediator RecR n=1 Tax=Porphyromonas sp. COT-052 OH4946 TaxID=1515618 RepID=UPI00051DF3BF|nr:recombination mediator RecR [Porphyromonas sp. COT-052 OH4946]KGL55157.1 recombinase RecR [Porphyromonas sp. COT-052 OH4946]